jgi:HD-GYP domain-containing protein (c-di-GMP phosphodiesterase class II)
MNFIISPLLVQGSYESLAVFDIEEQLRLYPYDAKRLEKTYKILDEEIRKFDPLEEHTLPFGGRVIQSYGEYLDEHLTWTSDTLKNFLKYLHYENDIAEKVAQAFKRHDIGKPGMPGQWKITEEKQVISEEQRAERTKTHCILGAQRIQNLVEQSAADISPGEIMSFTVARYMAMFHHERLNGSGPFQKTAQDMCPILRCATIVDTFHGKLKAGKSYEKICEEMASSKHEGEFDLELLKKFADFLHDYAPTVRKDIVLEP